MKRIIGIVLLILAVLAAVHVARKLSQPTGFPHTSSSAYNTGHKAGMLTAPVVLGAVGLWLVLASGKRREGASSFPTRQVVWGLGITSAVVIVALLGIIAYGSHRSHRGTATLNPNVPVSAPNPGSDNSPPSSSTNAGPYNVGDEVAANWGGKWTPGKITTINPGGFTLKVQLEDPRFPHPILLSTNQIRVQ